MAPLHGAPDRAFDYRVLRWLTRGRVLAEYPGGVAEVDVAATGELPTIVRAEASRPPLVVHVGDDLLHVRGRLRFLIHPVRPHPPRGAVHEHDQVDRPPNGRFVGAGQIDMHHLHGPRRARCRPPRYPGAHTLRLHAPSTWLQHARHNYAVLPGRCPQQILAQVACEKMEAVKFYHLNGLSKGKGTFTRSKDSCSSHAVPNVEGMPI